MGTEAAWIPAVVALIGAGVQQYNTSQTAKKRDQDIARGIRDSAEQQKKANLKVGENLNKLEDSRVLPFKEDLQQTFLNTVNKKRLQGLSGLNTAGQESDAYKSASGKAKTGAIDYAGLISSLLAGVDAPGNQRQAEGTAAGTLGMDLSVLDRNSDQDSFLAQLRAARHRDNPWLSIAGAGLSGYATGMAGAGYGGGSTAVPAATGVGQYNTGIGLDKLMYDPGAYRGIAG